MKKRIHQIELFIKYPNEVQEDWRIRLIQNARSTEFGKKYDFTTIRSLKNFKERVPVSDYEQLKPYITRLMAGENNILWPSEIKWFSKSSGTTSDKSKFIPVTNEALEECHFKGGKDLMSLYCHNMPQTNVFSGKGLIMGGSHTVSPLNPETYFGDISAVLLQNLPFWVQFLRTPDLSIALMDKWEEKIEKIATATINENVTSISGVPTWTLVLINRMLELSGRKNLLEIWPNLELFVHGAVSFIPYVDRFKQLIPSDKMNYVETYNASEGFFGIQDRIDSDEMLLMLDYGIYFEFMPLEELGKLHPRTHSLEEVEIGRNYALIISTNAGLWRYLIGDTIRFSSLQPYRIKITGRTKAFINAFGEEVVIENADMALKTACEKTSASINDYTVAPVYFSESENGAHEWLIEFETEPDNFDFFVETLDNALKSLNSDYEAKRYKSMALRKPIVKKLPENTFYNWLKSKNKLGGQFKVPRLSNDRKYAEELYAMLQWQSIMTK